MQSELCGTRRRNLLAVGVRCGIGFFRACFRHVNFETRQNLKDFCGVLQADGYAGFGHLYQAGHIQEAACMAHVRRKFYDIQVANGSPIAAEAIQRIGALYDI
jgi:hypothetical protein